MGNLNQLTKYASKQQGIVLLTALIMVIAVASIAIALMSSSSVDVKITNAAQDRETAENELVGEVQKLIAAEANLGADSRFFYTNDDVPEQGMQLKAEGDMTTTMVNLNRGELALECPRSFNYTAGISCNMLEVTTTVNYGSKNKHALSVVAGIAQEMSVNNKGM